MPGDGTVFLLDSNILSAEQQTADSIDAIILLEVWPEIIERPFLERISFLQFCQWLKFEQKNWACYQSDLKLSIMGRRYEKGELWKDIQKEA